MPEIDGLVRRVLAVLNTLDVEKETDALESQAAYERWAKEHAPGRPVGDVGSARAARDALRAAAGGRQPPADALERVPLRASVDRDNVPELTGDDPVADAVAASVLLAATGDWHRIKLCTAEDCKWAFRDASKNGSRRWCSMGVCGNRAKTRTLRERRRAAEAPDGA